MEIFTYADVFKAQVAIVDATAAAGSIRRQSDDQGSGRITPHSQAAPPAQTRSSKLHRIQPEVRALRSWASDRNRTPQAQQVCTCW